MGAAGPGKSATVEGTRTGAIIGAIVAEGTAIGLRVFERPSLRPLSSVSKHRQGVTAPSRESAMSQVSISVASDFSSRPFNTIETKSVFGVRAKAGANLSEELRPIARRMSLEVILGVSVVASM